jgi:hypothetical protein
MIAQAQAQLQHSTAQPHASTKPSIADARMAIISTLTHA